MRNFYENDITLLSAKGNNRNDIAINVKCDIENKKNTLLEPPQANSVICKSITFDYKSKKYRGENSYTEYLASKIYELQMSKFYERLENHNKKPNGSYVFDESDYISIRSDKKNLVKFNKAILALIIAMNALFFNPVSGQVISPTDLKSSTIDLQRSIKNLLSSKSLSEDQIERIKKFYPEADLKKYPYEKIEIDTNYVPVLNVGDILSDQILNMSLRIVNSVNGDDSIKLSSYADKNWIILNGWADWCSPCKQSLALWEDIYPDYKNDIAIIGLHLDFDYKAPIVIDRMNWTLPHIIGGEAFLLARHFLGQSMAGPSIVIHKGKFYGVLSVKPKDKMHVIQLLEGHTNMSDTNLKWLVKPVVSEGGEEYGK